MIDGYQNLVNSTHIMFNEERVTTWENLKQICLKDYLYLFAIIILETRRR